MNSFDSNYYVDFCILKFVKLLIKSPSKKLSLANLSPTVDSDRRPCSGQSQDLEGIQ